MGFRPSLLLYSVDRSGASSSRLPAAAFQPVAALCERSEALLLPILAFDWMKLFFFQDTSKRLACQGPAYEKGGMAVSVGFNKILF